VFLAQHRLGGDQVVALSDRVVAGVFGTVPLGQGLLGDGASLLRFLRGPGGLAGRPDRLVAFGVGSVDGGAGGPMSGQDLDGRRVRVRRGAHRGADLPGQHPHPLVMTRHRSSHLDEQQLQRHPRRRHRPSITAIDLAAGLLRIRTGRCGFFSNQARTAGVV
jgi:hypothetical protein